MLTFFLAHWLRLWLSIYLSIYIHIYIHTYIDGPKQAPQQALLCGGTAEPVVRNPVLNVASSQPALQVFRINIRALDLGRDMGGVQNVWGEENVPENALSRKFLDPSKRAPGLLCRGFL